MATLSEANKTQIRSVLGASRLFVQLWAQLENAMNAVESVANGGTQPDDSAVVLIQSYLSQITCIDNSIINLYGQAAVLEAGSDKVRLDAYRGLAMLKSEGRRCIGRIADTLSCRPLRDVYASPQTQQDGENSITMSGFSDTSGIGS